MTGIGRGSGREKGREAVERECSLATVLLPATDGMDQNNSQGVNLIDFLPELRQRKVVIHPYTPWCGLICPRLSICPRMC